MQIRYFQTAWNDIKNSPGWFGKLCRLALVGLIPIFGQIVIMGYLYGWAREIAWGVHEPLPEKVFGNEDGKLYRRGWFIFVLSFVLSLVPGIIVGYGSSLQQIGMYQFLSDSVSVNVGASAGVGSVVYLIGLVLSLVVGILVWVGSMRIAIYDRLSPGFQLGKIWNMIKYDSNGIVRIFGMNLLVGAIVGFVLGIIISVFVAIIIFAGVSGAMASGVDLGSLTSGSSQDALIGLQVIGAAGLVGILGLLIVVFIALVASTFVEMLVARAMGYWTLQFDVPHWRGQDDPMPFEVQQMYTQTPPQA